ncbi:hypothetical protein FACHB389_28865 [Nostoc calcicola FACHB-389]|nr:hypothetical protein FACHB389_28865 [Nostoc calcicola FACHB-389]
MRGAIAIRDRISLSISILISKQEITDKALLNDTIKLPQGVFCFEVNVFINAPGECRMINVIGKLYYQ